jgi:hypothetical protein
MPSDHPLGYFSSGFRAGLTMWSNYHRWLLFVILLLAGLAIALVTNSIVSPTAVAFSFGPPPGYTRAPGEEPEACAECHLSPGDPGSGQISISAPPLYVPGQTYQITVTHTNPDPSRRRWGFQLTALDPSDEKAGELQSTSVLTQITTGGPGGNRQYIEHTSSGTFIGQQGGASWTFNWTAPPTDVGVVTFYAAGNHANNNASSSGDYIYFTFTSSQADPTPQLRVDSSGPAANQAAAFDSLLLLRDPFPKQSVATWWNLGSDQNTRVIVFVANLALNVGDTITVNLVDANSQSFDVVAEDARTVPNSDIAQIRFRLPNEIMPGVCTVKVRKGVGPFSNSGSFRIAPDP